MPDRQMAKRRKAARNQLRRELGVSPAQTAAATSHARQPVRPAATSAIALCAPLAAIMLLAGIPAVAATPAASPDMPRKAVDDAMPATDGPKGARAASNAVEIRGDARSATLSFTISSPVEARAFVMERPDRIIIELPEVNFQLPLGAGRRGQGIITSFRYGMFAPGKSRIVIDLAAPAVVTRAVTVQPDKALPRLEIDISRVDRARFQREALRAAEKGVGKAPPPAPIAASDVADQRPVIVLDPGHGGLDNGAISSAGLVEKEIVLAFALRLREQLEATGRYQVVLTRDTDSFVALSERVRIAQQNRAALFLSIHADILRESPEVRGATVYTGSKLATDTESAQLADKENDADSAAGVTTIEDNDQVAGILLDLTMRETRSFSRALADRLVASLGKVIRMNKNPHRSARFIVLTAPDTPSALLEIGYLSSTRDADLMNSPEWRDRTTAALTKAINQYFDGRRSMTTPRVTTR